MGQLGFFDAEQRLAALSAKGDPLEAIDRLVPWESFRAEIEAVVLTPDEVRKSSAGRKPIDAIVLFRMLVLQALWAPPDQAGGRDCATAARLYRHRRTPKPAGAPGVPTHAATWAADRSRCGLYEAGSAGSACGRRRCGG